jgi:hypothetical protein
MVYVVRNRVTCLPQFWSGLQKACSGMWPWKLRLMHHISKQRWLWQGSLNSFTSMAMDARTSFNSLKASTQVDAGSQQSDKLGPWGDADWICITATVTIEHIPFSVIISINVPLTVLFFKKIWAQQL